MIISPSSEFSLGQCEHYPLAAGRGGILPGKLERFAQVAGHEAASPSSCPPSSSEVYSRALANAFFSSEAMSPDDISPELTMPTAW